MNLLKKTIAWYFSKKALPYWCILLLDSGIIMASDYLTYALNNGTVNSLLIFWQLMATFAIFLIFYLIGFRLFHTYSGIIRYSSFVDLQRVGFAMLTGIALILVVKYGLTGAMPVDVRTKDIVVAGIIATMLMWVVRVVVKYLYDSSFSQLQAERIFIYGVKNGGISLAKSIRNQDPARYILEGFVSDEPNIQRRMLMGVRVFPNDEMLVETMRKKEAKILFVSPLKNDSLRENTEMVNRLTEAGIKMYMVPEAQEWDGKQDLSHSQLREVEIEDLLPRDKIEVDMRAIGKQLLGKRIAITGAAGSIGSEMVRQVALYAPSELVLIDQAETPMHDVRLMMKRQFPAVSAQTIVADITNRERMEDIFSEHRPEYVFHAAAYKHVPMMEDNPGEAIYNNVEGTRIIADLSVKYGAKKFVMISTDKAVNPTNVMGCSKRICEIYVQSLDRAIKDGRLKGETQFVTTRFGNVLGSNGSVIPLFKEQIKNGGPVTVTHPDIIRFFMLIPEACKLVLEAGTMGNGGEIFVFDMGKPVKIVDLARRMIRLSGAKDVEIKFTGLRDGEKLYEEVLNDKEITLPTFNKKIKIARVREYEYDFAKSQIDDLVAMSYKATDMEIVKAMKAIVPEYKSQHSKYEALDKKGDAQL